MLHRHLFCIVAATIVAVSAAKSASITCTVPEFKSGASHDVVIRCDAPLSMKSAATLEIKIVGLPSYEVLATVWTPGTGKFHAEPEACESDPEARCITVFTETAFSANDLLQDETVEILVSIPAADLSESASVELHSVGESEVPVRGPRKLATKSRSVTPAKSKTPSKGSSRSKTPTPSRTPSKGSSRSSSITPTISESALPVPSPSSTTAASESPIVFVVLSTSPSPSAEAPSTDPSPSKVAAAGAGKAPTGSSSSGKSSLSTTAIIGIVVGCGAMIGLVAAFAIIMKRNSKFNLLSKSASGATASAAKNKGLATPMPRPQDSDDQFDRMEEGARTPTPSLAPKKSRLVPSKPAKKVPTSSKGKRTPSALRREVEVSPRVSESPRGRSPRRRYDENSVSDEDGWEQATASTADSQEPKHVDVRDVKERLAGASAETVLAFENAIITECTRRKRETEKLEKRIKATLKGRRRRDSSDSDGVDTEVNTLADTEALVVSDSRKASKGLVAKIKKQRMQLAAFLKAQLKMQREMAQQQQQMAAMAQFIQTGTAAVATAEDGLLPLHVSRSTARPMSPSVNRPMSPKALSPRRAKSPRASSPATPMWMAVQSAATSPAQAQMYY